MTDTRAPADTQAPRRPLESVTRACHDPIRSALDEIESRLSTGILGALRRGRELHRELIAEVDLEGPPPDGWEDRSERLLAYRRRLSADVLEPMLAAFRSSSPVAAIAAALRDALKEATEAARLLPGQVEGAWPENALRPAPSDDLGRRLKKLLARGFGATRKAGGARSVPVRAVALHHLGTTLSRQIDDAATDSMTEWCHWTRGIELLWMEWGEDALPALVRAELPGGEEDGGEEDGGGETSADPWTTVREAAARFDDQIASLIEACPAGPFIDAMGDRLRHSQDVVEGELAVAGSFVFDPENTHRIEPTLQRLGRLEPKLEAWDDGVANRLRLYETLLAILSGATAVQRRLVWRVRDERLSNTKVLTEVAAILETMAQGFSKPEQREPLAERLDRLDGQVAEALEPTRSAIPAAEDIDRTVEVASTATVEALLTMIRQAPASLELHPVGGRLPRDSQKIEARTLAVQDLARQSFDAMRIERIRSSTTGLVGSIDDVRTDVDELPNVFAFAFEAAEGELSEGAEGAEDRATGLVTEALLSMAESLRGAQRSLDAAVRRAQIRLASEVSDGSLGLLDRVGAGHVQARLLAARSRFAELRAWVNEHWGPPVEAAARAAVARWRVVRRWASRGLRKGTEIVGTGPGPGVASVRTVRTLSEAATVLDELPLVYQRLFTLDPIADPSLLAGRVAELGDGLHRWERWRSADGVPLIVRGRPGSGITSFMNVLLMKLTEDDGEHRHLTLDERIDGEESLARLLGKVLDVGDPRSVDELVEAVFDAPDDSVPRAVMLDNLEHLYLRVPRGTDLIERVLTLMAETEPRIFWIGGITSSAWQLVETAEPTAISLVDVLGLEPLSTDAIREAVMLRHRRSGLSLRYEEPAAGRRMLRRRLRRLRDREGYDELLADDFFSRLEKTSSGNLRLALFQWVVAADFGQAEGVVVRPPERPDFSVLDSLGLTQNFTLKAFVEHRTLTLDEHDRIFRLSRQESYQIFESLQNRHLIESVAFDGDRRRVRSEIQEDLRYRVTPLLVGAVISHLRGRNIFH